MTYDDFTKQDLILLVSNLIDGIMQDDEEQAMIFLSIPRTQSHSVHR